MKKSFFVWSTLLLLMICISSCDKYESTSKEIAKKFVQAYNENDKIGIYDLFPSIKECNNLSISGKLSEEDFSVEKDEESGLYLVSIDQSRNQRLVFEADSDNVRIIDSYGIFRLDSTSSELALKTGVPLKKLSDIEQSKLLNPEGDYVEYLYSYSFSEQILSASNSYWSWGKEYGTWYLKLMFTVTNYSKQTFKADDYYVEITPLHVSDGKQGALRTVNGEDLAPNECREFMINYNEYVRWAYDQDFNYHINIKIRSDSAIDLLLNHGNLEGNEYNEFMKHPDQMLVKRNGKKVIAQSKNKTIVYAYKEKDQKSDKVDTLYHGQPLIIIEDGEGGWYKYYKNLDFVGYVYKDDFKSRLDATPLELAPTKLTADNVRINVYPDEKFEGKPVKQYTKGTYVLVEYSEAGSFKVYEKAVDGSVKFVGYIKHENIDEEMEDY